MEDKSIFDKICSTPIKCFLFIFISTYLMWWLVLDGPKKWDKKFHGKLDTKEKLPLLFTREDLVK